MKISGLNNFNNKMSFGLISKDEKNNTISVYPNANGSFDKEVVGNGSETVYVYSGSHINTIKNCQHIHVQSSIVGNIEKSRKVTIFSEAGAFNTATGTFERPQEQDEIPADDDTVIFEDDDLLQEDNRSLIKNIKNCGEVKINDSIVEKVENCQKLSLTKDSSVKESMENTIVSIENHSKIFKNSFSKLLLLTLGSSVNIAANNEIIDLNNHSSLKMGAKNKKINLNNSTAKTLCNAETISLLGDSQVDKISDAQMVTIRDDSKAKNVLRVDKLVLSGSNPFVYMAYNIKNIEMYDFASIYHAVKIGVLNLLSGKPKVTMAYDVELMNTKAGKIIETMD